eukprot:4919242-Lingulodinium_polyedra.AAC.1
MGQTNPEWQRVANERVGIVLYLPNGSQVYAPRVDLAISDSGLEVRWDLCDEGEFVPTGAIKLIPEIA